MERHTEIDYKITWEVESTEKVEIIIVLFSLILLKKKHKLFSDAYCQQFSWGLQARKEKEQGTFT